MNTKINIENISALIEFNFEEVKLEYVKDGKLALEEIFGILKRKNENVFYDKKKIVIIYETGESRVQFFIYSSGKIWCVGARSEEDLYCALERHFQKAGAIMGIKKPVVLINNIMATAMFDYKIYLDELENYVEDGCKITYEPGIFPRKAIYKSELGSANIFLNGKIVVIAKRKDDIVPIVKNIEEIIAINKAAIPL